MDGRSSYAIFLYLDEGIDSTSYLGYDASDGFNHYVTYYGGETTTNVHIPGMFIFQLWYPTGKGSK